MPPSRMTEQGKTLTVNMRDIKQPVIQEAHAGCKSYPQHRWIMSACKVQSNSSCIEHVAIELHCNPWLTVHHL